MGHWYEEIADEIAVAAEHVEHAAPVVWARSLLRDRGREGAVTAILESGAPPVVRRIALEELAR